MSRKRNRGQTKKSGRQKRRRYSDAERRRAVADVAAMGVAEAARVHGIPKTTLHAWTKSPRWKKPAKASAEKTTPTPAKGRRWNIFKLRPEDGWHLVVGGWRVILFE